MVLGTLLVALLFIAGLMNILFVIPTNKICSFLQIFFPSNKASNSSVSSKVERDGDEAEAEAEAEESSNMRKVFSTFDKNGDGFITRQELKESLKNIRILMTDAEIDDIVARFDSNGDGLLDFSEFCLLTKQIGGDEKEGGNEDGEEQQGEKEGVDEVDLKEAFDVFDKDRDGVISVEELALVLTSLGLREGKRIEECKDMISKVDLDGDGMVNFDEFKTMMITGGKLFLAS